MAIKRVNIIFSPGATGATGGTYFPVPDDFGSLISIEAISGGGGGSAGGDGHGGGGGGYVKITGCTGLIAGATAFYYLGYGGAGGSTGVGREGGPTWFNTLSNSMPTPNSVHGLAVSGGRGGFFGATGATGIALGGGASGASGAFIGSSINGATGYVGGIGR